MLSFAVVVPLCFRAERRNSRRDRSHETLRNPFFSSFSFRSAPLFLRAAGNCKIPGELKQEGRSFSFSLVLGFILLFTIIAVFDIYIYISILRRLYREEEMEGEQRKMKRRVLGRIRYRSIDRCLTLDEFVILG